MALLALAGAGATSSRQRSRQCHGIRRGRRSASPSRPAARFAAQRQLHDHRAPRPGEPHAHRRAAPHLAQHLDHSGDEPPLPPLLQRLAQHPIDLDARARARRRLGRGRPSRGGLGLDRRHEPQARRHERRPGRRHLCACASSRPTMGTSTTARWPRCRSRRRWRPAKPSTCRSPGPRACRAPSRAPARSATTTSSRSGFRRSASFEDTGWNCHQFHAATEFFSDFGIYDVRLTVPSGWIVGATGTERGRRDEGDRHDDASLLRGGRPRFRLDDEPGLRRADRAVRPRGRCRAVSMRLLLQPEHVRQAERHFNATRAALRYYGEWFGPYPYGNITIDRSGLAERRGRHGVSDALHRGHALAGAAHRRAAGRRDGPRSRPSVLVRHRRDQRVRARVDGRGLQHVLDRADPRAVVRTAALLRSATSAGSCRGCSTICPLSRATDGNRLSGYRDGAELRHAVDADVALLARHGGRDHLQQDRAVAATRSSACSGGTRCSGSCRPTSRATRSSIPSRRISSPWPTRSAAAT